MAGINPGMIIKVAADIRDAVDALAQVVTAEGELQTTTDDLNDAYGALDVAIGTFAANAASELFKLAFDAVKALGNEIYSVVDAALHLHDQWKQFTDDISDSIRESGVLQAGLDSLGASLLSAFGGTRAELVQTMARLIEQGALKVLDLTEFLINLGVVGARGIAALIVPIDAVLFVLGDLASRLVAFETTLLDMATQVPGVGAKFDGLAAQAHAMADATKGWTENTYNQMIAHQALVNGTGPVIEVAQQATEAIHAAKDAMLAQRIAADATTGSIKELTDANAGLVLGDGEAVVALYNQTKALEDMDAWSRKIKNTDPWAYLKEGMTKTLPPLEATTKAMKDTGKAATDMSDDVKFAAEVVAKATLSWSEAMELVRQGQGTMTGQVGPAQRPPGISDSEWALMQNDPRAWEAQHGYDWASTHAGTTGAWSMGGAATTGGTTVNQSVTVNTVAGDKQAIATVVKDALASDWRSSGVKA
jgi:hypothetical protein